MNLRDAKRYDIGVGHLAGREAKIFLDSSCQLQGECLVSTGRRRQIQSLRGGNNKWFVVYESYQRRKCIPSPKGYHEAKPGEEKDAAVDVDGVQKRDGLGFMAGRVHLRDGVEVGELETHGG